MNESELDVSQFEARVRQAAQGFAYPRTPAPRTPAPRTLAPRPLTANRSQRARRLAFALLVVLALMAAALAVPQVRAAVLRVLRLGAVQIILPEPTAAITLTSTSTITVARTPLPPRALLNFGGQTTLAHAQQRLNFPIKLPAYPPDLGNPDVVYLQHDFAQNDILILVWTQDRPQAQVRMSLHMARTTADNPIYTKMGPRLISETVVNGQRALWTEGPYLVQLRNGDFDARYLITGRTLIWTEGTGKQALTYRLETALPLDEAIKVAESLRLVAAR